MKKHDDRRLVIGVVGWTAIVMIWLWISARYFCKSDPVGGILAILVAAVWGVFGWVSVNRYLHGKRK